MQAPLTVEHRERGVSQGLHLSRGRSSAGSIRTDVSTSIVGIFRLYESLIDEMQTHAYKRGNVEG